MVSKLSKIVHVSPMLVTFKHLFKKAVTVQYPEERLDITGRSRGLHIYDPDKCLGCGACARVCPNKCIKLKVSTTSKGKKKIEEFSINIGRCMFCGLCVDYCIGKGVLKMSTEYEYSEYDRKSLVYGIDRLVKKEETGAVEK